MQKKKIIILILPIKLRPIDIDRYDVLELEKNSNVKVEIHEVINFLYPGFEKAFMNTIRDKRLKSFETFESWKKNFQKIINDYNDILILKNINSDSSISLRFNLFFKRFKKVKVFEFSYVQSPNNFKRNFLKQIEIFFATFITNPKKIFIHIRRKFYLTLAKCLKVEPNYFLKTGHVTRNIYKNAKIYNGNSFDYNMFLKQKKNKIILKKNYGLFLESPSPLYSGDSYLDGAKVGDYGTPEKWFKSLDRFFSAIEKYKKIKIKVVSHPKVKHKSRFPSYYYGREVLKNRLPEIANNAQIFISRDSVGLSFATFYNKPAVLIFTNEFIGKKNNFLEHQNFFAKNLGTKPINIDTRLDKKIINELFMFNKKKYQRYIKKYISVRKDKKNNYKILSDIIQKL